MLDQIKISKYLLSEKQPTWFEDVLNHSEAKELLQPDVAIYLIFAIALFYVAKKVYDWTTPFNLNEQLTTQDNKAVALSFTGYLFGVGVIVMGILSDGHVVGEVSLWNDIKSTAIWCVIGITLLQVSRIVNDKVLMKNFNNVKELVEDKNIGTGAVECGSFIGSALLVKAALFGESANFTEALLSVILFFICGQIAFVVFGFFYQWLTKFDLHEEIENDNVAAGVGFGMSLIAIGIMLSGYVMKYDSIAGFGLWLVFSIIVLISCRVLIDKVVLPGGLLDDEIVKDKNWGAALIEGGVAIVFAMISWVLFL